MKNHEKAICQLQEKDINAKFENGVVYVEINDIWIEISDFEMKYQARMYDEEEIQNKPDRERQLNNLGSFLSNDPWELDAILDKLLNWKGDKNARLEEIDQNIILWSQVEHFDYKTLMEAI